jgi:hypothetical protein
VQVSGGKRIHDLALGLAAGAGAGLVAGLFGAARLAGGPWFPLGGVPAGGLLGLWWLGRLDPDRPRLITPRVAVAWLILAGSIVFLGGLAAAIARFE